MSSFWSCVEGLLLLPDCFRGMGTWQKTLELQKQGNFSRSEPEVAYRKGVAEEQTVQRARK